MILSSSSAPPTATTTTTESSSKRIKNTPAKVYPFTLDTFQKTAIDHIDNGESVLVSAHTSAGKTAVAEYAIAVSLRDKQRVIYTSPIKALSNQKFRDLKHEFNDVGLMTGDVTIDPNSSCLVMTTEILRSMLYRGSEIMREVAWVVFDEVHYLRDLERGVVWEESIILLPHKVRFVFLSATIPNSKEFAAWVAKVHQQPCHVVYTDYRPTPLQHYVFPSGGDGLFLIVDADSKFRQDNFESAMTKLAAEPITELDTQIAEAGSQNNRELKRKRQQRRGGKAGDLDRIIKLIIERKYEPVIVFSFSKRECETYALQISKTDLTDEDEKDLIGRIFENAIDSLSEDDRQLPQVVSILPLLKSGIGIHHGGLLPILKEIVEILFGEGLIKCLFATETFAMGINMPAKTVVFTALRKFDGSDFRLVRSGEYIQMSGRAGRRGKDDRGIVILMMDEKMEPDQAREMMSGQADALTSSFHVGYNMLLNLLRVEDADPEFMVRNSLFVFQQESQVPLLEDKLEKTKEEAKKVDLGPLKEEVLQLHTLQMQLMKIESKLRLITNNPKHLMRFLTPGRLVKPYNGWDWGVVIEPTTTTAASDQPDKISVLIPCAPNQPGIQPLSSTEMELEEVCFSLFDLEIVSSIVVYLPKGLCTQGTIKPSRRSLLANLRETQRRFKPNDLPGLDPVKDLNLDDEEFKSLKGMSDHVKMLIQANPLAIMQREPEQEIKVKEWMKKRSEQYAIERECVELELAIKQAKQLPLKEELKKMKVVLRRLGHTDSDNVVQLKGTVACVISTCDELLATELLLGGAFNNMDPAVAAAMVSCMAFNEPGDEPDPPVRRELQDALKTLQDAARRIAEVQKDAGCEVDVEEYVKTFRPDLMEVVYLWARGGKFREICDVTSVFEGTIVRAVRREVELLRQLCSASRVVGDDGLEKKFGHAVVSLQRGVIFSASLYL